MVNFVNKRNGLYAAFIALSIFILTGCSGNVSNNKSYRIYSLEEAMQNCQNIYLSDYASDITYVTLETTGESIIGNPHTLRAGESNFYVYSQKNITVFDSNGKFIALINNNGRGPMEYMIIQDFAEKKDKGLCVLSDSKVLNYSIDGKCNGCVNLVDAGFSNYISSVYVKDGTVAVRTSSIDADENEIFSLYIVDSLLNVKKIGEMGSRSKYKFGTRGSGTSSAKVYSYKGCLRYLNPTADTLYVYDENHNKRFSYAFDYGKYNPKEVLIDNPVGMRIYDVFETDAFLQLTLMGNKNSLQQIYRTGNNDKFLSGGFLLLDKQSNQLKAMPYNYSYSSHGFINDIDGGMPFLPNYNAGNKMYQMISAEKFIQYAQIGTSEKMKEIAATLTEESNPVLVVATLK